MTENQQDPFVSAFKQGRVIAYPTEAVFGLGCDPANKEAVERLLALKKRPVEKGLILIADTYSQVLRFVNDAAIPMDRRSEIFSSWPGPVTWLLPASEHAPEWITGGSSLIAVRVTDHPVVRMLCQKVASPLVSTSANLSGQPPARDVAQVQSQFGDNVYCIEGEVGQLINPTTIRNGFTGEVIRAN